MVNIKLVKSIKKSFDKGIPVDEIRRDLISQHWSPEEVNEAIDFVQAGKSISDIKKPVSDNKTSKRAIKIAFGVIFVLILVCLLIFYLINYSQPSISYITISEFNILEGVSVDLSSESQVNFSYENEKYILKAEKVNEKSIILGGDLRGEINLGEEMLFDLNQDSLNDFSIRLDLINSGVASLYLKAISDFVCPENWNCTDWSPCLNGTQKRVCIDMNSCGTEINKPGLEQKCNG